MAPRGSNDLSLLLVAQLNEAASRKTIKNQLEALKNSFQNYSLNIKVKISKESIDALKELKVSLKELATLQKQTGTTGGTKDAISAARLQTELAKTQKARNDDIRSQESHNQKTALNNQKFEQNEQNHANKLEQLAVKREQDIIKNFDKDVKAHNDGLAKQASVREREELLEQQRINDSQRYWQTITGQTKQGINSQRKSEIEYTQWWETQLQRRETAEKRAADKVARDAERAKRKAETEARRKQEMSFGGKISKNLEGISMFAIAGTMFFGTIRALQAGFTQIKEIDSAMTDLKKVTDETAETYRKFGDEANRMAGKLGSGTVEVVKATAEFSRLGYALNQAKTLAQQSILYSNVGGMGIEDASQALISTVKGFGIEIDNEGKNIEKVVDVYNEVGNNFAISSQGIGEAVRRSASAMKEAGNDLNQTVALVTAANASVQDPEVVGTAIKTVSERLRGVDEEGNKVLGLTAKLEKQFNSVGLTLMKDNDTFKSTFEIMQDLAGAWDRLTDLQRADFLEQVAGKRQANVVASMIANWKDAESVMVTAMNSQGSAAKENEKYLESIEAKQKQLSNAVTGFWQAMIDPSASSAFLTIGKSIVEVLTALVKAFDTLPVIIGAASTAYVFFKSVQALSTVGGQSAAAVNVTLGATFEGLTGAIAAAGGAMAVFNTLLISSGIGLLVVGISFAISKLVGVIGDLIHAQEKHIKSLEDEVTAGKKAEESLKSLSDQYNNLSSKVNLTSAEKDKLRGIQAEIAKQMPQIIKYYDEEGNAVYEDASAVRELVKELKKQNAETERKLALAKEEASYNSVKKINELVEQANAANEAKAKLEALQMLGPIALSANIENTSPEQLDVVMEETMQKVKAIFEKYGADFEKNKLDFSNFFLHPEDVNMRLTQFEEAFKRMTGEVSEVKNQTEVELKSWADDIGKIAGDAQANLNNFNPNANLIKDKVARLFIDALGKDGKLTSEERDSINKKAVDAIHEIEKAANDGKIDFSKLFNAKDGTANLEELRKVLLKSEVPPKLIANLMDELAEKIEKAGKSSYTTKNAVSDLVEVMKGSHDSLDELATAFVTLERGQKLNYDQISKLLEISPDLAENIKVSADGFTVEANAITLAMQAIQEKNKEEIKYSEDKLKRTREEKEAVLQASIAEVTAIKSVTEARAMSLEQLAVEVLAKKAEKDGGELSQATIQSAKVQARKIKDQFSDLDKIDASLKMLNDMRNSGDAFVNNALTNARENKSGTGSSDKDPFVINEFEHELAKIDLELAKLDNAKKQYKETDKEYADLQQNELNLLKQKQDAYHREAETIRNVTIPALQAKLAVETDNDKKQEILKQLDDADKKANEELPANWLSVQGEIVDILDGKSRNKDRVSDIKQNLETGLKAFDEAINNSQARQSKYAEITKGYRDELNEQNKILKQKADFAKSIVSTLEVEAQGLEKRLVTEKMTGAVYEAVKTRLDDIRSVINDTNKDISSWNEQMAKNNDDITKSLEDLADQVVQAYKDVEKAKHDAAMEEIDRLKDAENDRHEATMDALDEELKKFEQVTNDKIKLIDKEYDEIRNKRDYDKEVSNREKIQEQINRLALDNSAEGKAKLEELKRKLAEQDDKLRDMREKKLHDERKDNLQDELDRYKRNKDEEKKKENERHDQEMRNFEELKDEYDDIYEKAINNEEKISALRKAVFNGDIKFLQDQLGNYFHTFDTLADGTMSGIGAKVRAQLDLAQQLQNLLNSVNNQPIPSYSGGGGSGGSNSGSGVKKGGPIVAFDTGGYTGEWSGNDGRAALLHQKEIILNQTDTANLLASVKMLRSMPAFSVPNFRDKFTPSTTTSSVTIGEVNLNIERLDGDENGAQKLVSGFVNKLKKKGIKI